MMARRHYLSRSILPFLMGVLLIGLFACQSPSAPLVTPHNLSQPLSQFETAEPVSTSAEVPEEFPKLEPASTVPSASDPAVGSQILSPTPAVWKIHPTIPLPPQISTVIDQTHQLEIGDSTTADLVLSLTPAENAEPLFQMIYAAAAPFATTKTALSSADLSAADLVADPETAALWQETYPQLQPLPSEEIKSALWNNRQTLAFVPFEQLTPALKALPIDGMSLLDRDLETEKYPLVKTFYVSGDPTAVSFLIDLIGESTNRDETKLTRLAMTGVTALVRATAAQMEVSGVLFPGEEVAPILQTADIAHISNEVPFAENCPYPDATSASLIFCSRDHYFELLTHLGVDIIEVTGNHSNDYGPDSMVRSLDLYEAAGMVYYGGGRDLNDAREPAILNDHGNTIAFVGCNPVGPVFAWATESSAGATPCNDYAQIEQQISTLRDAGHVVVATMQYQEIYSYAPTASQIQDFGRLANAGASVVSGSQSHHPQAFAITENAFIHYGLGNLFFDQMNQLGTRQMFVDTYVIYDGRVLNVELWTGLIEFYARPRPMTPDERDALLNAVFAASGW